MTDTATLEESSSVETTETVDTTSTTATTDTGDTVLTEDAPAETAEAPAIEGVDADWRANFAGEDEKLLGYLNRYSSLGDALKGGFEAKQTISRGIKAVPDENSTPEEWSEYRKEHGIPESPADYEITLKEGYELTDADKPYIETISKIAHKNNLGNEAVTELALALKDAEALAVDDRINLDNVQAQQAKQLLRENWGHDYQTNNNILRMVVEGAPEAVQEAVAKGRGADGVALMNNPGFIEFMVGLGRQAYPHASVIPNSENPAVSVEDEITELESKIGTDEYKKDNKIQDRLMALYDARERLKAA